MKHLDLFSGIGGFALATEMVWEDVEHIFCDNDLFCHEILKKHWPKASVFSDIRGLTAHTFINQHRAVYKPTREAQGISGVSREALDSGWVGGTDILTGGFPCQPFSQAGRRKGTEDDRYLWPEMLRVIREFHPRWVIGENVGGLVTWNGGMVLEQVHADLESEGYEVQAFIIPAVAVNAPHRRDRVWIVGHASSSRAGQQSERIHSREQAKGKREKDIRDGIDTAETVTPNTFSTGAGGAHGSEIWASERGRKESDIGEGNKVRSNFTNSSTPSWKQNWLEVATRLCTVDDGLPNGLVRPRGWRNAALKGAGNAIVPQVAAEIMQAIKQIDK